MRNLCNAKCTACSLDSEPLTLDAAEEMRSEIPDWKIISDGNCNKLVRVFKFNNFQQSLEFTNKVGEIAEENGHHPAIMTEWGRVTVTYWTHKIKGLHESDFIMSAKTDKLYGSTK